MVPEAAPYRTWNLHQCHTHAMGQLVLPKALDSSESGELGASQSCPLSQHEDSFFKSPTSGYPGAEMPSFPQNRLKLNQIFYELSFFLSFYHFCSKLNFPGSFHCDAYDMILSSFVVLVNLTVKVSKKFQTQLHLHRWHH